MKRFAFSTISFLLTCFLGFGRLGYDIYRSVTDDGQNRIPPVISTNATSVGICPNGRIQHFDYTITDNRDGDISGRAETFLMWGRYTIQVTDSDGNLARLVLPTVVGDEEPPVIHYDGEESYDIHTGDPLTLEAPPVTDNCDDVVLDTEGAFDINTAGEYTVKYSSRDTSDNYAEKIIHISVTDIPPNSGVVYLTFDDGPGAYTDHLLDILAKYDVKATFFVTCRGEDSVIKRAYDEGHAIGLHTCSHDYADIYSSVGAYFADLYAIQDRVKNITGSNSTLIRFPGGSSNLISAKYSDGIMSAVAGEATARGFTYFDWNLTSGDAGEAYTSDDVYANVTSSLYPDGSFVVLQHDIKDFSVDAVERIITFGLKNGYSFSALSPNSPTAHHRINN